MDLSEIIMSHGTRTPLFLTSLAVFLLAFSHIGLAEEEGNGPVLQDGQGYLLIRIVGAGGEKDALFQFRNNDTDHELEVRSEFCQSAGPNARLCIVSSPPGRYYWSRYESETRFRGERSKTQDRAITRDAPSSEDDTFEIVSGAINYVGDWEMRITFIFTGHADSPTYNNTWSVDIQQNTKSLERLFDLFPEYTARYPISLSMMGKEAISLQDFLKLVETNSN